MALKYDPDKHSRHSIRLSGYNYAQPNAYFVTMCSNQRECLFGEITDREMRLNEYGQIVHDAWLRSEEIRREIELDAFVVMPNHIHGIVIIHDVGADCIRPLSRAHGRAPLPPAQHQRKPHSLGSFIAGFKSATTRRINAIRDTPGLPVWQRNYYEHIIRNEDELHCIRQYIADNPMRCEMDQENPYRQGNDR